MDPMEFFAPYILPAAIFMVALGLVGIGSADLLSRRGRQRTARGEVSGHVLNKGEKGDTFTSKVRFTTDDGRQIEFVDGFGVYKRAPAIGKPLTVTYPADHPERARVSHPFRRALVYLILIVILGALIYGYLPTLGIGRG